MSLAKNIKQEMCIKMIYKIITLILKCIPNQTAKFNNAKPQLLLHQPNILTEELNI